MFFPVWEDYDESEDGRGESQDPGAQSLKGRLISKDLRYR
jgi:hypothetical protein